jgi:2-polyprenyl-3-methyl-5-hydroxy-6-metoxy-1,4-benzoquinol methylase
MPEMKNNEYIENCDLCGKSDFTPLLPVRDYRFGGREFYKILRCNGCNLICLNPRPSASKLKALYMNCYTPEVRSDAVPSRGRNLEFLGPLKPYWHWFTGQYYHEILSSAAGRILDVGCAEGGLIAGLKERGLNVYGVELNQRFVEACRKKGLSVHYGSLFDACFVSEYFDTVIMSQVLEHVPSPVRELSEVHRILRKDGNLLVYTPNAASYLANLFGRYWHGWYVPFHSYFFTISTIKSVAEAAGFKVASISTRTPDNFLVVSIKSALFGRGELGKRPCDRGGFLDSYVFRLSVSPLLRFLDLIFPGRGDCIAARLIKAG